MLPDTTPDSPSSRRRRYAYNEATALEVGRKIVTQSTSGGAHNILAGTIWLEPRATRTKQPRLTDLHDTLVRPGPPRRCRCQRPEARHKRAGRAATGRSPACFPAPAVGVCFATARVRRARTTAAASACPRSRRNTPPPGDAVAVEVCSAPHARAPERFLCRSSALPARPRVKIQDIRMEANSARRLRPRAARSCAAVHVRTVV